MVAARVTHIDGMRVCVRGWHFAWLLFSVQRTANCYNMTIYMHVYNDDDDDEYKNIRIYIFLFLNDMNKETRG